MSDSNSPRRRPGRPRSSDSSEPTRDVILRAAAPLFARFGCEAVTVRRVAEAAGVDVATMQYHFGSKQAIYEACFERVYQTERRLLEPAIALALSSVDGDLMDALHRIVDAFIDFAEQHPENTGLWLRRWLDPQRHEGLDERFSTPLYAQVEELLREAHKVGVIVEPLPHLAVRSLIWAVHSHAVQGLAGPVSPDSGFALRAFLHRWLDRMYAVG
jgi:AcrR family transcriptional regulator